MVTWFAGLFYLPRLYVYHAMTDDEIGIDRFITMERKLYRGIMAPAAILTLGSGIWLASILGWNWIHSTHWFHHKLALVTLLVGYHLYLGAVRKQFERRENNRSHIFYRWINELPVLVLVAIVVLAVTKPFTGASG